MTRRKVAFWDDVSGHYYVSQEFNGDKAEMEMFGLGSCDANWPDFMALMDGVANLADFLKVIAHINNSYHATVNGVRMPELDDLPGTRLEVVKDQDKFCSIVEQESEVWLVKRGIPGAQLVEEV